jgi:transposase
MNKEAAVPPCPYAELSREELVELVKLLVAQNKALVERIEELERRLGLNSHNSSKSPSSDGLSKSSRTRSTRGKSGRPSGGQPGHKGETLKQVDVPDEVVDHYPEYCMYCTAKLETSSTENYRKRQVFDIQKPKMHVTEHRTHKQVCPICGKETQASFPADVQAPVQYGKRVRSLAVYLQHAHFVPEDRLSVLLLDVCGIAISTATLANIGTRASKELEPVVAEIKRRVAVADVKHLDETGFRIEGKTQWLHVQSTETLTYYRSSPKRGDIPRNLAGTVVHDHFKPYYTMGQQIKHGLCNTHHLRELQALVDIEKEEWAALMQNLLRCALKTVESHKHRGIKHLPEKLHQCFHEQYDKVLAQGLSFHESLPALERKKGTRGQQKKRVGHNLLLRLQSRKEDVLRFMMDFKVPFTNNQAEQDIRMMKVKQKISGGFRSSEGAETFCNVRSVISTTRKKGLDLFDTLSQTASEIFSAFAFV